jgi:hypothetical protein
MDVRRTYTASARIRRTLNHQAAARTHQCRRGVGLADLDGGLKCQLVADAEQPSGSLLQQADLYTPI